MRTTAEETELMDKLILDAAIEVFSKVPYDSVNMQDIAEKAGVSRGPLYYRYKTKADLFRAAYNEYCVRKIDRYREIFSQDKPILERVREDMEYCLSGINLDEYIWLNNRGIRQAFPDLVDKSLEGEKAVFSMKVEAVRRAMEAGELRSDADPNEIVNLIFIFAEGLFVLMNRQFTLTDEELGARVDDLLDIIEKRYGV